MHLLSDQPDISLLEHQLHCFSFMHLNPLLENCKGFTTYQFAHLNHSLATRIRSACNTILISTALDISLRHCFFVHDSGASHLYNAFVSGVFSPLPASSSERFETIERDFRFSMTSSSSDEEFLEITPDIFIS